MKNLFLFVIALLSCSFTYVCYAQSVAINTSGTAAHPSAMLDITATNKGLLIPRMSSAIRSGIGSPATGLQVFDTDTKSFWFWNGTAWVELSIGSSANLWSANGSNIYNSNTGNVGIGLNTPLAPLHIKNELEALRIQGTTPYLSFYNNAGSLRGFIQQYNDSLLLGTPGTNTSGVVQFYISNQPTLTLDQYRNVSVGDNPGVYPTKQFSVSRNSNAIAYDLGSGSNWILSSSSLSLLPVTGNVGINAQYPANKLQIGSVAGSNFSTNDFAIGNGTAAMAILQTNTSTLVGATTDMSFRPRNDGTGNFGINVLTPTNHLQIGSVGATGFATNDLAIGNGTNAMAIYQTDASTLIGSSTDIILKPRNNNQGRVGINTTTPRAPLDVAYTASAPRVANLGYSYLNVDSDVFGIGHASDNPVPLVSIMTDGRVLSTEFDAYSDARIKQVIGKSNSIQDLQTINQLEITDYAMKDKVQSGNKIYKKVIAQQVEKFYPQVVSKHTDFIPNVYQITTSISKVKNGYLLTFEAAHTISDAAKKLRVLLNENEGMQEVEIVSIPSKNEVVIRADAIKTSKVFVYGEEVADFRTVDYEGLMTLNISATQELSKLIKLQQAQLDEQAKKIALLTEAVKAMRDTRIAQVKQKL